VVPSHASSHGGQRVWRMSESPELAAVAEAAGRGRFAVGGLIGRGGGVGAEEPSLVAFADAVGGAIDATTLTPGGVVDIVPVGSVGALGALAVTTGVFG